MNDWGKPPANSSQPNQVSATSADFPTHNSLCEGCGYRLTGVNPAGHCPECGAAVDDSHPRHRTGPSWQNRTSLHAWLSTWSALTWHPKRTFRKMRLDGPNWPGRIFLLIGASIAGGLWLGVETLALNRSLLGAWIIAMVVTDAVIILAYIEAAGVSFFSRRRGWVMPFNRAERVACYASIGLVLAALILVVVRVLLTLGPLGAMVNRLTGQVGYLGPFALFIVMLSLSVLGFETLVWLGAKQIRYANAP